MHPLEDPEVEVVEPEGDTQPSAEEQLKAARAELDAIKAAQAAQAAKAKADAEAAKVEAEKAARLRREQEGDILGLFEETKATLADREAKLAELAAEVDTYKAREAERVGRVEAANAERVKALPKEYAAIVPAGMGPDALAEWLGKIEALAVGADERPAGTITRSRKVGVIPSKDLATVEAAAKREGFEDVEWYYQHVHVPRLERAKNRGLKVVK